MQQTAKSNVTQTKKQVCFIRLSLTHSLWVVISASSQESCRVIISLFFSTETWFKYTGMLTLNQFSLSIGWNDLDNQTCKPLLWYSDTQELHFLVPDSTNPVKARVWQYVHLKMCLHMEMHMGQKEYILNSNTLQTLKSKH